MRGIFVTTPIALLLVCAGCAGVPGARREPEEILSSPWDLTPQQQAQVDQVLESREQQNGGRRTEAWTFTRWEYDPVFGDPHKPSAIDEGKILYRAPDKAMFWVQKPKKRQEKWVYDGASLYEYNFAKRQLIEHKLPAHLRGKLLDIGFFPLLLSAKASKLRRLYHLRVTTPDDADGEVWLEACPRFGAEAAWFSRAELILATPTLRPLALQVHGPNRTYRTVYSFRDAEPADPSLLEPGLLNLPASPFWKKIVEPAPTSQVGRRPDSVGTR